MGRDTAIVVRPATVADSVAFARVNVDTWHSTYRGIVPDDVLARQTQDAVEGMIRADLTEAPKDVFSLVAESGSDGIVGIASAGPNRFTELAYGGEVYAIYVLKEQQRAGVGRSLLVRASESLLERGYGSMLVQVLENNPSRKFYESMGGVLQPGRFERNIGGTMLWEVVYVWPDLSTMTERGRKA